MRHGYVVQSLAAMIGLGLIVLSAAPAIAQQTPPGCTAEHHDDFDFWIGTWNVYAPDDGAYQGLNRITVDPGHCLIREDWQGAGGSTGHSMNFHDPFENAWRQVWVSSGAIIDYTGGLDETGTMVLTGQIHYPANGVTAPFRGLWTPLEDGRVRQHFDQQTANGEWQAWFTGIYVRVEEDPRAAEAAAIRGE